MNWRDHLSQFNLPVQFAEPASQPQLAAAERSLGIELPPQLRDLLLETDGIRGEYDLPLVWSLDRIVRDNRHFRSEASFRTLYMPFDPLLFFSDAGNGDQFAFSILAGEVRRNDIFVWNHEDDSRTWVAANLRALLDGWISGKIRV
jgi:hypothetical protein